MKILFPLAVLLTMTDSLPAQEVAKQETPLDSSFLRRYAETRGFMLGRPVKPKPTPDGKAVLFLRSQPATPKLSLFEFEVASGTTKELLTPETVLKGSAESLTPEEKARRERMRVSVGGFADFQLTEDGKRILLTLSGKLYVYDRDSAKVSQLPTGKGTLIDPKFSSDGSKVAYVLDHDVFVFDLAANKETQVTKGGSALLTHGLAEFVAQEEMHRFSGYWWSPDGKFIVYEEADHDGVEIWYVADPAKPDQKPSPQYYPRPGKKNVAVRLGIVPITGGETVWVGWDVKKYEYLAAVKWDKAGPLTVQVQDRKQQVLLLLRVEPATGKTTKLLEEKDAAFVNIHPEVPQWIGGSTFLWISEMEGALTVEARTSEGTLQDRVAGEKEGFQSLISVHDPKNAMPEIIYRASQDPTQSAVFRRYVPTLVVQPRTPGSDTIVPISKGLGDHSAVASKNHDLIVLTSTSLSSLPRTIVLQADGTEKGKLPSVATEPGFSPKIHVEKIGEFYTAVIRPHHFDSKKKYPVILDVYGGPHHLTVQQQMRPWLLMQWLADQGFVVVALDNRGTPGRGRNWERSIYQKFGSVPLDDQVAGLKLLGEKHPEMDLDRVGIVGWSFGGYMSALAVLKRPDVFKAAVAGAPVTDWEDYDSHYTERYMGLLPESKQAYHDSSLLPLAPKLERPLLLVHGTADDNVYFRHTLRLIDALFRAGRDFEALPLPSLTHMVPDPIVTERLWTRIAWHFRKNLGEAK